MYEHYSVIDISRPITSTSACFPGDRPFSREITLSLKESKVVNLCSMTMSPHVGTHADSSIHIQGDLSQGIGMAGDLPLTPFLGPVSVIDLSPMQGGIEPDQIRQKMSLVDKAAPRILFKTASTIRLDVFEESYAYFSEPLIEFLSQQGTILMGIDTPSVDDVHSKNLPAHHCLASYDMCWLENLDLRSATEGNYFLIALPLKFMELEASPVRAVLLAERKV